MNEMLCGCGKAGVYVSDGVYSCSKYKRCMPYEELKNEFETKRNQLRLYIESINKIDDYFEYNSESRIDKKFVYSVLGDLNNKLIN